MGVMRFIPLLSLALWAALAAVPAQAGGPDYVIRFSHVVSSDAPKGRAALFFRDLTHKRLKGRVRVEVFPDSQLYDDNEVLNVMRQSSDNFTGLMAAPSLSKFTAYSNALSAFDLPFLIRDVRHANLLADSPLARRMTEPLKRKGLRGLSFWDNGMKVFTIRGDHPLRKVPEDFVGKRFRIQNSDVHEALIEALGGEARRMPFKAVFSALNAGEIDGQENAWSNIRSQRFHLAQDHLTVSEHGYLGYLVVVNNRFWNALPFEVRRTLEGILKETAVAARRYAREAEANDRATVTAELSGEIATLSRSERLAWERAAADVEARFAERIGPDLLQEIRELLGR